MLLLIAINTSTDNVTTAFGFQTKTIVCLKCFLHLICDCGNCESQSFCTWSWWHGVAVRQTNERNEKKNAIYAYITRRVSLLLLLPRRVSFNVNCSYVVTPLPFRTFVIVFFMEFVLSNFLLFSTTSWVTKEKSENVNNAFGSHLWDNLKVFVRTPIVCWTRNNNNNGYSFTVTGAILWHYL